MTTLGRIIRGPVDVREGANWLASHDPRLAWVLDRTGPLPLRLAPQGFKGLLDIIVSQQVSVASANAIRARMDAARLTSEAAVLAAGEEGMRAAGFSKPKARYAVALAQAKLDYMSLRQMPDAEVIAALTSVLGIGPWTAKIYVMFCMGRADMFPPGDLALQEAARVIYDLPARPTAQELEQLAETWSPWRSVAARALFAYYRDMKNREGLG